MNILVFLLNLPWTLAGLALAILSIPSKVELRLKPMVIIFRVRSLWWYRWLPGKNGTRATTNGHIIQLSPSVLKNDIQHELIHVEQHTREPFIHPFLYVWQSARYGYAKNKYEVEAYERTSIPT